MPASGAGPRASTGSRWIGTTCSPTATSWSYTRGKRDLPDDAPIADGARHDVVGGQVRVLFRVLGAGGVAGSALHLIPHAVRIPRATHRVPEPDRGRDLERVGVRGGLLVGRDQRVGPRVELHRAVPVHEILRPVPRIDGVLARHHEAKGLGHRGLQGGLLVRGELEDLRRRGAGDHGTRQNEQEERAGERNSHERHSTSIGGGAPPPNAHRMTYSFGANLPNIMTRSGMMRPLACIAAVAALTILASPIPARAGYGAEG